MSLGTILRKPENQEKRRELERFYCDVEEKLQSYIHGDDGEVKRSTSHLEDQSDHSEAVRNLESEWNNRIRDYMNTLRGLTLDFFQAAFLDDFLNKAAPFEDLSNVKRTVSSVESLSRSSDDKSCFDSSLVRFLCRNESNSCLKNPELFKRELILLKDGDNPSSFQCRSCGDLLAVLMLYPERFRRHFKPFGRRRFRKVLKRWIKNPATFPVADQGQATGIANVQTAVNARQVAQQADDQDVSDEGQETQQVTD